MKNRIYKTFGVALALVLVFGLVGAFVPANTPTVEAQAYTPNQWNIMDTPTAAGRCLVPGSNVTDFAVAADGTTIYLANDQTGGVWGLAKSTNGGRSFTWIFGNGLLAAWAVPAPPAGWAVGNPATLIAVAPDDPNVVAVVESTAVALDEVWISTNGGSTWASMAIPGLGAGERISDIAVSPARVGTIMGRDYVVSTYDIGAPGVGTFGDIYVMGTTAAWVGVATAALAAAVPALPALDFTSIALAPNWVGDRVVVGVGSGNVAGGNTEVPAAKNGDTFLIAVNCATVAPALAGPARVILDAAATDSPTELTDVIGTTQGEIEFSSIDLPSDFDSTSVGNFRAYLGWTSTPAAGPVITNADDAYRVDFNSVRKLEVRPTVSIQSVSYFGTVQGGTLMVGEARTTAVWYSSDPMVALPTWGFSFKNPTGATNCIVALTSDTAAFGGGSGVDSAFSYTADGGLSFNGLTFIDEAITLINDVMPAPDGSALFMATEDATPNASLWRCYGMPGAGKWERVGFQPTFSTGSIVRLSPDYLTDTTVYWFDQTGTRIRRSTSDGQIWGTRTGSVSVDDAAIESQDVLYTIDAANGDVYTSTNGGWFFGLPVDAGLGALFTIAMAPSYPETPVAGNVLVGAAGAGVGLSTDGAASFRPLLSFVAGATFMEVFADGGFANNNLVYAGSFTASQGIYKYQVDTSSAWEQIRAVGATASITGLTMKSGLLYGSWNDPGVVGAAVAGDAFTIMATAAGDNGTIQVAAGSIDVTGSGAGGTALAAGTMTPASGALTWTLTAAGNWITFTVTPAAAATFGTYTIVGVITPVAAITVDADGDATVWAGGAAGTGPFSLPDAGAAGAAAVVASSVERGMYPTAPAPLWLFQTMNVGAGAAIFTAAPSALRASGDDYENMLWAIDTAAPALLAYIDTMAKEVPTASVPSEVSVDPATSRNAAFTISFDRISNAMAYDIDICRDEACTERAFRNVGFVAPNPASPEWLVNAGENYLSAGKTYYVRVRATDQVPGDAINSYWSNVAKFDLEPGVPVQVSYLAPQPLGPVPGAIGVPLSPGFTWAPYLNSTKYEFKLAKDAALTDIVATDMVATTAYLYADKLAYGTTYFWAVRAIEPAASGLSPVSSFTTEKAAPAPPAPPAPPTPAAPVVTPGIIWAIIAIGAILVIAVIVLILRTRRVA